MEYITLDLRFATIYLEKRSCQTQFLMLNGDFLNSVNKKVKFTSHYGARWSSAGIIDVPGPVVA